MKFNQKGFTLIEMLAVVVILSILMAIMIPSVNHLITRNQENDYANLKKAMISGAKIYLSDYRYDISVSGTCNHDDEVKNISSIGDDLVLVNSKLPIQILVNSGNIKTNQDGNVKDPRNTTRLLDLEKSYVLVQYVCKTQEFSYRLEDNYLVWK